MSADPMTALAMTGATTIVAAMATSAWQTTRDGTARLFNRGGRDLPALQAQLDGDADIVAEDDDTDGARQDLVGPWRRRLTALLREHPEVEAELRALVDEARRELAPAQQNWIQHITAHQGLAAGTLGDHSSVTIHYHSAAEHQPSASPPSPATPAPGRGAAPAPRAPHDPR
ncbi:hypothetical protein [Streptomyces glycanivorans]|uniref:SMODS and SLOG-associating 2TM effector domain-containing protein n=1 Tax=Streptomyces glycanivorans TaxID=3033808 RepID=A0ABY9JLP6_9ACTN|nr:hypothetical protein [Streptomyces sp. Alt3]WLQ67601.1 hypothetical protein P8A20_30325 [Streptomyces sp. Alt3]